MNKRAKNTTSVEIISPVNGIASMSAAMQFAGVKSRQTMLTWERKGLFPKRVKLQPGRVGYRWADLYEWSASLETVEGGSE